MAPDRVCKIIGACAVLHNIAILLNEPMEDGELDDDVVEIEPFNGQQRGLLMRDHIRDTYFS